MKAGSTFSKSWPCLLVLSAMVHSFAGPVSEANRPAAAPSPGGDWFADQLIPHLSIHLDEAEAARLRQHRRQDVAATVSDGSVTLGQVAVHLKGSTGSFRDLDDKPALTLTLNRFVPEQRLRGLSKIHLNNSVEDPSYFNELAGSLLFLAAGVPAPRVTHALVELNGRPLGLYVLKEGFTREFLGRHFRKPNGNLYDTGAGYDVDEALERDLGDGPDDRRDLVTLTAAAREPDLAKRWETLGRTLEVDRFVSFMAMEVIACHRDGYCLARNNFRVYHDLDTGRLLFFPHGMDQLFGRPDATPTPAMAGLVARAVMETSEGRRQYRERLGSLLTNVFDVAMLHRQADAFVARVKPMIGSRAHRDLERAVSDVKERMAQRRRLLEQQLNPPESIPVTFENGVARLVAWRVADASVGGRMDRSPAPDGRNSLHILASAMTSASWRTKVLLPKGHYRFQAAAFTKAIQALSFGNNQGAGLRVAAMGASAPYQLVGDHTWTRLEQSFALETGQEVELLCELRAAGGEVWFDTDSLRLIQAQGLPEE
jgi:hypothetical protein